MNSRFFESVKLYYLTYLFLHKVKITVCILSFELKKENYFTFSPLSTCFSTFQTVVNIEFPHLFHIVFNILSVM